MKTTQHVEYLLRQGRKPKELLELGFPKRIITRVRRQLKDEKMAVQLKIPKGKNIVTASSKPLSPLGKDIETDEHKLMTLNNKLQQVQNRVGLLEKALLEKASLEDIEARLIGTIGLNIKQRFTCNCGASGFIAMHIQCTKCGRETWWGWFSEQ